MDLVEELEAVTAALDRAGIEHAVCGGIAVTLHGFPRATRDIDLLIPTAAVEAAVEVLKTAGFRFRALPMTFGRGTEAERTVHRVTKIDGTDLLTVDLIQVEPGFQDVWASRERLALPSGSISTVSASGLARMKRLAGRPQDLADLERLGLHGEE